MCVNDVTDSAQLREELRLQATHDALTGCLNRAAVMQTLERMLTKPDGQGTVAIFIDIDNFKPVNDRLGHAAGDELLIALGRRLQKLARPDDLVARLGGDEFLLVCHGPNLPDQARAIAKRVRDALNHPVALPTGKVNLQASIGIAFPKPGTTADQLIATADTAMYQSKRQQSGKPALYTHPIA